MTQTPAASPSLLRRFMRSEASGGILLMFAAAAAMIAANSPVAPVYFEVLHAYIGPLSVLHWINDALMALFFLLVGLEIKRELVDGHLSTWADRALPTIAAAGGMIAPALVYLVLTADAPELRRGWAIPCATDIAFAIGVIALLGKRVPMSLKVFLTTVAIVDDMGAVAIIAVAYTEELDLVALTAAAAVLSAMYALNRARVDRLWPYLILAVALWIAVFLSGVHATIAGVAAATVIPIRTRGPETGAGSPLHRLEHALQSWVAYGIVPVFGFANAGVSLTGVGLAQLLAPLPLGIALGLFLGKQIGIFGSVWLCARTGLARPPAGATWGQIYGVALLCGIGFTMSLFIGSLAFDDPALMDQLKIGVLGGSLISALIGYALLRTVSPRPAISH